MRRKRSVSDLALHLVQSKKDDLRDEDLQGLVRLCGKSQLCLPSEYAPSPLTLPTCFRATAHFLVQHGKVFALPMCFDAKGDVQGPRREVFFAFRGRYASSTSCTNITVPRATAGTSQGPSDLPVSRLTSGQESTT